MPQRKATRTPASGSRDLVPPELGCFRLELRAVEPVAFEADPARSLHAALHRALEVVTPSLARWIHDEAEKPVTLSPLYRVSGDEPVGGEVTAGERVWARVTALDRVALDGLVAVLGSHGGPTDRPVLQLEWRAFAVEAFAPVTPAGLGLQLLTTYSALYDAATPAPELALRFRSPVAFRNKGRHFLQPDPRHVFASYLRRWARYSGMPLPGVDNASISTQVVSLEARVEQRQVRLGSFAQPGFIGWARYRAEGDEVFRKGIAALADYAAYCGTGARTAFGMGQTERLR